MTAIAPNYEGSITLPETWLRETGIYPYERVLVLNLQNGARFETYVLSGEDPRAVILNGPASRMGQPGDTIFVLAFCLLEPRELEEHQVLLAYVEDDNARLRLVRRSLA